MSSELRGLEKGLERAGSAVYISPFSKIVGSHTPVGRSLRFATGCEKGGHQ